MIVCAGLDNELEQVQELGGLVQAPLAKRPPHDKVRNGYEDVVHEHAGDGWRLVQIFAPGVAAFGAAKYYELIFQRERAEDATAPVGAGRHRVASTARV